MGLRKRGNKESDKRAKRWESSGGRWCFKRSVEVWWARGGGLCLESVIGYGRGTDGWPKE